MYGHNRVKQRRQQQFSEQLMICFMTLPIQRLSLTINPHLLQIQKLAQQKMTAISARFFNPQTLSLLFCLQQLQKMAEKQLVDMKSDLVKFLLNKILSITDSKKTAPTNADFQAQLLSLTNNQQFLDRYRNAINTVDSFNKFYGEVSNILKNLRGMRNTKLEQSNLVDFFVRRLYIYFEKLDFKEIVNIYEAFVDYRDNVARPLHQHEFMLTKSIEEIKFNLENYSFRTNPEELEQLIEQISADDHTFKTSYLKGLIHAQKGSPAESAHYLRRYFDKNLSNLFQDRIAETLSGNKINHCILSGAYAGLQLQHLDQCLQAISEGLRISQNNADEESINNCIIYLYHVAQRLGKYKQQILLSEHAITHSLNQNNLTLTLYSCLSCSLFQKKYDIGDASLSLLKTREVNWKDALHFAKKKLHSNYENNCRNIFHLYRNLLIPSFLHKLALLAQLPALGPLLLNPYYARPQLLELSVYKQFNNQNQLSALLDRTSLYSRMGFQQLLNLTLLQLSELQHNCTPYEHIRIQMVRNEVLFREGSWTSCYKNAQNLLEYCHRQGYAKGEYITTIVLVAQLLAGNELLHDALIKIEQSIRLCTEYRMSSLRAYCLVIKAGVLLRIGHLGIPIDILKQLEQKGSLSQAPAHQLRRFHQTKLLLNQKLSLVLSEPHQIQTLHQNILEAYHNIISLCMQEQELGLCERWLARMHGFVSRHPVYMGRAAVLQEACRYCEKVRVVFGAVQCESADDGGLVDRVMAKLGVIYGGAGC